MSALYKSIQRLRNTWYTTTVYKERYAQYGHTQAKYDQLYLDDKTYRYVKSLILKEKILEKSIKENQDYLQLQVNDFLNTNPQMFDFGGLVWAMFDYLQQSDYHL